MEKIITRFAPSPTGTLHLGGARTALFNFLFSRHHGGKFILRIEDTDRTRSTDEYTQDILGALTWLGIKWDEGPYYQSQRMELYHQQAERLISEGKAYRCYCTPEELEARRQTAREKNENTRYDGHCRDRRDQPGLPFVVRFRTPQAGATSFTDLIHGSITFVNSEDNCLRRGANACMIRVVALCVLEWSAGVEGTQMHLRSAGTTDWRRYPPPTP